MANKQLSLGALEYLNNNFEPKSCSSCGSRFWAREEQNTCGDAPCAPYTFIGAPVLNKYEPNDLREFYLSFFERRGHVRVFPYPVIARWREDVLLVNASIYDFQPLVTSGKVPPPANPLTISQPCIRLKDIDTVGKSGRHLTNFEMMAHHAFNDHDGQIYWKNETVQYCDHLLHELGAEPATITYKETPWAGGGNAGISLEVLVGGLELATLVFMDKERSKTGMTVKGECYTQMKNSIVDTGYGLERMVWAGNGMPTIYDAVMPDIVNYLIECTGLEHSLEDPYYSHILAQNARFAGMVDLNASNLLDLRKRVAKSIGIDVDELVRIVEPIETLYTIADHSRCLVFMLGDGIVPSNVKAGYLARLVIRKVLRLLQSLSSAIPFEKIIVKQIEGLNAFPKYTERADTVIDIIRNETEKYSSTIDKGRRRVSSLAQRYRGQSFPTAEVIKMYDSYGVPPEIVEEVATEIGARVELPDDFYSLVAATHERVEEVEELTSEAVQSLPVTHRLFYDEPEQATFTAHVVGLLEDGIILDKTLFYPGGGGQPEDTGYITAQSGEKLRVRLARLQGHAIIHEVEDVAPFSVGDQVIGDIDVKRRQSLARHHTAAHVLLASIRDELGGHIWQEGAQKGVKSSRLDVSHYKKVTDDERKKIELRANELIMADTAVETQWMDRNEAEQKFGFALYQGGVPPGEIIRTVQVGDDVQACAGTHMTSTGKIGPLRIIKTERIQDGVERFEFAAGVAAVMYDQRRDTILGESSQTLRVPAEQLPVTVGRFFEEWKTRGKENEECKAKFSSLASERTSIKKAREAILEGNLEKAENVLSSMDAVFERLTSVRIRVPPATAVATALAPSVLIVSKMKLGHEDIKILSWIIDADIKELLHSSKELLSDNAVVVLGGVRAGQAHIVITMRTDLAKKGLNAAMIVKEACSILGGSGGGRPERAQGGGPHAEKIDEAVNKAVKLISEKLEAIGQTG
ncbi:MAG: alanine--tRNA ligase [Euryarchaeota archaeon]|jgi:alanyl-tRNA synthetase|nr:alanine--tRNA ligase [Euryarchaeota archaeon]